MAPMYPQYSDEQLEHDRDIVASIQSVLSHPGLANNGKRAKAALLAKDPPKPAVVVPKSQRLPATRRAS